MISVQQLKLERGVAPPQCGRFTPLLFGPGPWPSVRHRCQLASAFLTRCVGIAALSLVWGLASDVLAQPRGPAAPDSPAVQEWLATDVGPDAATNFWLMEAARRLGLGREADQLRPLLVDAYLRQLLGQTPQAGTTVAQWLGSPAPITQESAAARWASAVNKHLVVKWGGEVQPIPRQFEIDAPNWKTLGPGLWHASRDNGEARAMVLALVLQNTSNTALVLGEFRLVAVATAVGDIRFDCRWPRGEKASAQAPGGTSAWLCQALDPPAQRHPGFANATLQLSGQLPGQLRLVASDFDDPASEQQTLARLISTGKAPERLTDFLMRNSACERRGDCHMVRPSVTDRPPPDMGRQIVPWTTSERVVALGVIVLAVAVYVPLARRWGNRRTALSLWLVGVLLVLTQWPSASIALGDLRGSLMGAAAWLVWLAVPIVLPLIPAALLHEGYRVFFERHRKGR